jgi:peptidoglycan/xylan/chitin deacetylase (PgdA/CDA1 family)
MSQSLHVVMYHYVRDLPNTSFPRIKGMLISDFRQQLRALQNQYEMATLESALDFLQGVYSPHRDLCLLTFDDGLKDHYSEVTPILEGLGIQGIFFVITSCLQEHRVAPVHMNHFLMAALDFELYSRAFLQSLNEFVPAIQAYNEIDGTSAQQTYPWDAPEVASFKYLFNFIVDCHIRDQVVKTLFEQHIGDEKSFSQTLYLSWEEARHMQTAGMLMGGHSHQHKPLASLSDEELQWDLSTCQRILVEHLHPQDLWPFSYPYGRKDSFNDTAVRQVKRLGFSCSFTTEVGANLPGMDLFTLQRIDCKDAPAEKLCYTLTVS